MLYGGWGFASFIYRLVKTNDIDLVLLDNAYDYGKSTGEIRRCVNMLGFNIRKCHTAMLSTKDTRKKAIRKLMEFRFPIGQDFVDNVNGFKSLRSEKPMQNTLCSLFLQLSPESREAITRPLESFLEKLEFELSRD